MGTTFCSFQKPKQDINTRNAVKIFQQAASIRHKGDETLKDAQQFIEEHFEKVLKDSHINVTSLSAELLCQLLKSEKLNIIDERPVWEAIEEWVKADLEARLETHLPMLVKECLRFGRLPKGFVEEFIFKGDLFAALSDSERALLLAFMNKILRKKQPKKQTSEQEVTDEFKPPLPFSRSLTQFCPRETRQYLVCLNYNYRQLRSMVEYYDYQLMRWRPSFFEMPPGGAGLFGLQAVNDGRRLFLFGGYVSSKGKSTSVSSTWTIDLTQVPSSVWTGKRPMLRARHRFSSVLLDGAIYALGGETQGDCIVADCERYNLETDLWTAIAPMNVARSNAAAAVIGGRIYIAGGCCPTESGGKNYLATVEVYCPQTNCWQQVSAMSTPRTSFALVAFKERLWAIAGYSGSQKLSSCESYDPLTDTWREEPAKLKKGHGCHQAVNFRGELYVVGGGFEYQVEDQTERYEAASKSWLAESTLLFNHDSHQLAVVPADCLPAFTSAPPEPENGESESQLSEGQLFKLKDALFQNKRIAFFLLSIAIAFLATVVDFFIFSSNTLSMLPGGPSIYIVGLFFLFIICLVALFIRSTDFSQNGFLQFNEWPIFERIKQLLRLRPFNGSNENIKNEKPKYTRGNSYDEYEIKHFYCISLAYYDFEQFNRNIIRKNPSRDELTKETIRFIKENYRMPSLKRNKKGVEEFERTLRRASFTVSKLPVGCKTKADTERFLRKELKQFKYEDKVCLLIYISSHGIDGAFFCEDGLFSIRRLIDQLELNFRSLIDSPKVIIVDTCRVNEEGGRNIVKSKNPTPPWPGDDIDESLKRQDQWWNPEPAQLLTVFSCLRKYYSYCKDGGLYTSKLTEVLKEHLSDQSFTPILNFYDLLNIAQERARAQVVRIDNEECYQVGIVSTNCNYDIILNQFEEEEEEEEEMKEEGQVEEDEEEEESDEDEEESDDYAESDEEKPLEFEKFFGSDYSEF